MSASRQLLKGAERKLQANRVSDLKLCLQSDDRDEKKKGSVYRRWFTMKDLIVYRSGGQVGEEEEEKL